LAGVGGLVQAGLLAELFGGVAAGEAVAADGVGAGVERVRLGGGDGDIDAAGVLRPVQRMLPRLAALAGPGPAALPAPRPEVTDRCAVSHVRILRVDDDAADVVRVAQAHVRPGLAGVGGLVDAVAPGDGVARVALAGADPDHVRVRRRHRHVAHAEGALPVEDRDPGVAVVGRLPQAAGRRGDVHDLRVALDDGDVHDAAAHVGRADVADRQAVDEGLFLA